MCRTYRELNLDNSLSKSSTQAQESSSPISVTLGQTVQVPLGSFDVHAVRGRAFASVTDESSSLLHSAPGVTITVSYLLSAFPLSSLDCKEYSLHLLGAPTPSLFAQLNAFWLNSQSFHSSSSYYDAMSVNALSMSVFDSSIQRCLMHKPGVYRIL